MCIKIDQYDLMCVIASAARRCALRTSARKKERAKPRDSSRKFFWQYPMLAFLQSTAPVVL